MHSSDVSTMIITFVANYGFLVWFHKKSEPFKKSSSIQFFKLLSYELGINNFITGRNFYFSVDSSCSKKGTEESRHQEPSLIATLSAPFDSTTDVLVICWWTNNFSSHKAPNTVAVARYADHNFLSKLRIYLLLLLSGENEAFGVKNCFSAIAVA